MVLEFQILQEGDGILGGKPTDWRHPGGTWKPLTEHSLRATETVIEQTLRMDYETFSNASFFLQGKADLFTQQRSGDRKRILGSILGLDSWEVYRQRANEGRRQTETEISGLDGRMKEIALELSEEDTRRERLKHLEEELKRLVKLRTSQEAIVQNARQASARLQDHQKLVDASARSLEVNTRRLDETETRLAERRVEQQGFSTIIAQGQEIEAAYAGWQDKLQRLMEIEKIAGKFRESEKQREAPRLEIQSERARLEQERLGLAQSREAAEQNRVESETVRQQLETARSELKLAETRLEERAQLDAFLQEKRQLQTEMRTQNTTLKQEMVELDERIKTLEASEEAECPLCGQPLFPDDRIALLERLKSEGNDKGDLFRVNKATAQGLEEELRSLEAQITELKSAEVESRQHTARAAQLEQRVLTLEAHLLDWELKGAIRLLEIETQLKEENYANAARKRLAQVDSELKKIGYDTAAHDALRLEEEQGRGSEVERNKLEQARAALAPLEREIADYETQRLELSAEQKRLKSEYDQAAAAFAQVEAQTPDLTAEEGKLLDILEEENIMRSGEGAARQNVEVLKSLKQKLKALETDRESLAHQVQLYRQLERAFGKDGVPALLIEQALPEIENKANETLERLSGGTMSVKFMTLAKYKDKTREDLKETLDIVISDGAGTRDYEMFSGGEAFRVNFAIRLALSEVLAQRAGARLQTLVIDEGFGSQDALGRQRLIEAINMVRADFAKILVITHIDELKDAFPTRIEVEKTAMGSAVKVT